MNPEPEKITRAIVTVDGKRVAVIDGQIYLGPPTRRFRGNGQRKVSGKWVNVAPVDATKDKPNR